MLALPDTGGLHLLRKPEPAKKNQKCQGRIYDIYNWNGREWWRETNYSLKKRTGRIREVERSVLLGGKLNVPKR